MTAAKRNDLSASLEDYLEAIYNLTGPSRVARSRDIAELLGVSKASVTGALRLLKKKGLANYKPYDFVTLTEKGRAAAAEVARRHDILRSFFVDVLGVDPDTATRAACKAEHTLGPKVIARLLRFIEFVTHENQNGYDLAGRFRKYYRRKRKK
ncbi:MAG TPA: metal-dependent transcriptional regulator [Sedimentisphaerales bacterium]|nr:metal-dependent transcriptional regulator [Sedimentisphaerales bacterium]